MQVGEEDLEKTEAGMVATPRSGVEICFENVIKIKANKTKNYSR